MCGKQAGRVFAAEDGFLQVSYTGNPAPQSNGFSAVYYSIGQFVKSSQAKFCELTLYLTSSFILEQLLRPIFFLFCFFVCLLCVCVCVCVFFFVLKAL
jgi:hypothetical protein